MPIKCPKNRLEFYDCLKCFDNHDGYCWGLCPPKDNQVPLKEMLTLEERMSLLEIKIENIQYLEDIENLEERLVSLESLTDEIQRRISTFQEIESKYNMMYDTMNNTLSNFSKKIVSLEEHKINSNKEPF
jgi:oligoendopeptidase F